MYAPNCYFFEDQCLPGLAAGAECRCFFFFQRSVLWL